MFNNSMHTLHELLKVAVSTNEKLHVFEYNEDDIYGFYVAEKEDDDFQVIIIRDARYHTVKTIAGEREVLGDFYNVYLPKYDEGDEDVGMQGYYYTDIEEEYDMTFQSAYDVAVKVASWIHEYEISIIVQNAAEYLWECEQEQIEADYI